MLLFDVLFTTTQFNFIMWEIFIYLMVTSLNLGRLKFYPEFDLTAFLASFGCFRLETTTYSVARTSEGFKRLYSLNSFNPLNLCEFHTDFFFWSLQQAKTAFRRTGHRTPIRKSEFRAGFILLRNSLKAPNRKSPGNKRTSPKPLAKWYCVPLNLHGFLKFVDRESGRFLVRQKIVPQYQIKHALFGLRISLVDIDF